MRPTQKVANLNETETERTDEDLLPDFYGSASSQPDQVPSIAEPSSSFGTLNIPRNKRISPKSSL
jgi:hypothetical protein